MTTLSQDTSPEAEQVQIQLLRQTPAWRKLRLLAQMNSTLHTLALSGLRERHPHATPADLWLGPELTARVYGLPPYDDVEGKLPDA